MFNQKAQITDEAVLAKFRDEHLSVNAVAKHFGITWSRAREFRVGFVTAGLLQEEAPEAEPAEAPEAVDADAGDLEMWTVHTEVPAEQLDALLSKATHDDAIAYLLSLDEETKAAAWQFILQRLVDRLFEPVPAVSDDELETAAAGSEASSEAANA